MRSVKLQLTTEDLKKLSGGLVVIDWREAFQ